MKKEKVAFNQLVAGALLKFGRLDSVDMTLLMHGIEKNADVVKNNCEHLDEYFIIGNGNVILNDDYVKNIYADADDELLERIQGNVVREYLDNLDMSEFVLRKIKLLGDGCIPSDDIDNIFGKFQMAFVRWLYHEGCIIDYLHRDCIYGDYPSVKLTKRGELYLFLIDNKKEVDEFCELIWIHGYDKSLIEAFLITQDLSVKVEDILLLDNFIIFCNQYNKDYNNGIMQAFVRNYNRCRTKNTASWMDHVRLKK